jgi:hypothetical protein
VRSIAIALLVAAQFVAAQSPVLRRASPLGIPAGRTTEVKLLGERLDEITDVWCSAADVRIETTNGPRLLITTPRDAVGLVALRVATTNGVSDFAMLMIDDLLSVLEAGTNRTVPTAQRTRYGATVDATTDELAFDFYSFDAKKGDTVSIDVVASRIGSKLDPVLRVLDARGREIAFCEDASGAARDCRLQFRPPASGEYMLEVRDIAYGGGPEYFYRLRLGKFGFATCTFPIVGAAGTDVAVLGPTGERLKSVTARDRYADVGGGFVAVRTAELAQSFEHEPNDALQKALPVEFPSTLNGRFEMPEDRDWFRFKADKDERLVFLTSSRGAGSPCDVFLELRDLEGKLIAESNPVGAQDTALTNKFASGGDYFLVARELAGRGAPDFAYQIEVRKFEPTFALAVDEVKFEAKNGAEFSVPISCVRYDFNEKIALEFQGLPDGFAFENAIIEEKKTNTTVKIKVPADALPGTLLAFSVVGSAKQKQVAATTMAALRRDRPLLLNPPPELDGVVVLGVTGADPAPRPRRRRT